MISKLSLSTICTIIAPQTHSESGPAKFVYEQSRTDRIRTENQFQAATKINSHLSKHKII